MATPETTSTPALVQILLTALHDDLDTLTWKDHGDNRRSTRWRSLDVYVGVDDRYGAYVEVSGYRKEEPHPTEMYLKLVATILPDQESTLLRTIALRVFVDPVTVRDLLIVVRNDNPPKP
jgi:hypothetical protein